MQNLAITRSGHFRVLQIVVLATLGTGFLSDVSSSSFIPPGEAAPQKGTKPVAQIQWGQTVENQAIALSTAKPEFKVGEAIVVQVSWKNFGKSAVSTVTRNTWIDYDFTVKRDGTDIPKSPYALQMIESGSLGRRSTGKLEAGASVADSVELDKGFDLRVPGQYRISATRVVYKQGRLDEYATLKSNDLTVVVR